MSFFIGQVYENIVICFSLGFALFLAAAIMDSREEEDHRGLVLNLLGAVGVMLGLVVVNFIAQWFPAIWMLRMPILWVLVFVCFRLSSLYEMVAMCGLTFIVVYVAVGLSAVNG